MEVSQFSVVTDIEAPHLSSLIINHAELISDAENDGVSYCTSDSAEGSCADRPRLPVGFITAAAMKESDDGSWIQVCNCRSPQGTPDVIDSVSCTTNAVLHDMWV